MIRFTTESGSLYELNPAKRLFRKVETTDDSYVDVFDWQRYRVLMARSSPPETPPAYASDGFEEIDPEQIAPGAQLFLFGRGMHDWIRTSTVVEVSE